MKGEVVGKMEMKIFNDNYRKLANTIQYSTKNKRRIRLEFKKLNKIMKFKNKYGVVTKKMFRCFTHLIKIYEIQLPNTLYFLMD